ncbi:MAG: hypothetical protein KAS67_01125 [Thermoplasmata archaeon]|nr:hypothetical protein [Thermoplasmata archaeon]
MLDSGADGLFLPLWLAEIFDLPKLEKIETSGVLKSGTCYKTKVGLTVGTSKKHKVDFGFVDAAFPETNNDIPILIGRDPLFKIFEVTFKEYAAKPVIVMEQKVSLK